jgi:starch synthase (maltosyl-transferring)
VSGIRVAERRGKWYHCVERWTDRWVSKHVCVSQAVRDFTVQMTRISAEKMVVIPNGVDVERFANASPISRKSLPGCDNDSLIALFVGRLERQKGVFDLLTVAENLRQQIPHLKWMIAGEGPLKMEMEAQINKMNLQDRVHQLGRRTDIAELMQTADLFVFPSRWEGMPNVILEAMAARLPIITYDVEGIVELLTDQQTGLIIPGGDIPAMAKAVAILGQNRELRKSYAEKAFQKVNKHFRWEQTVLQYQQLYESLISTRS